MSRVIVSSMTEQYYSGQLVGRVFDGRQLIPAATVSIDQGIVTEITPVEGAAPEYLIVPGFVDVHNHGGAGGSFPTGSAEECAEAALFHRSRGSTSVLASLVSAPGDELVAQTAVLADLAEEGGIAGIHLEGPFISSVRCGAQNPEFLSDGDPALFTDIIAAGRGHLKSITFAPETPRAEQLFELCAEHGVVASLGHTNADWDTMNAALKRGAAVGARITATHLFNAMPQIHHRDPGAAAALLAAASQGKAGLELVADGVHLADGTVDMVGALAGDGAFAVTDAMSAAGMSDGSYVLGHLGVTVADGVARLTSGGNIAGGTSTLAQQFQRRLSRGDDIATASAWTSRRAATLFGLPGAGYIEAGQTANLAAFALNPQGEIAAGRPEPAFTVAAGNYLTPSLVQ